MTLKPSPLEIVVSKRAARHLRVKPVHVMSTGPAHFITQWRADTADDSEGGRWFLMTNLVTLYTFMIPRKPASRFNSLVANFQVRLGFALLESTPPVEWRPSEFIPVKGNPRPIVGSMNEMAASLTWPPTPQHKAHYKNEEEFLQRTPFSAIGEKGHYEFPDKVWLQRLNDLARSES